jgi:hypothetical protein
VREDCLQVDELLFQLADYTNDYAEAAAETLFRKISTSWEAYRYLKDRSHDASLLAASDKMNVEMLSGKSATPIVNAFSLVTS